MPGTLGLSFSVLPVLVLFFVVYGTMGRALDRGGADATSVGVALGICLAWAIAASTPLFEPRRAAMDDFGLTGPCQAQPVPCTVGVAE